MRRPALTVVIFILILVLAGCAPYGTGQAGQSDNSLPPKAGESPEAPPTVAKVKIYLIALEDNGKNGKKLATGDSLVGVEREIAPTLTPLQAALNELFLLKTRDYGQSGLYNPLYQSDLQVESAAITDGKAVIRLTGNLQLGGELDSPRVEAQIEETALQFSTVKDVEVFLNNKSLHDALSLK